MNITPTRPHRQRGVLILLGVALALGAEPLVRGVAADGATFAAVALVVVAVVRGLRVSR